MPDFADHAMPAATLNTKRGYNLFLLAVAGLGVAEHL